ncbi:MAG: hypothetical protein M3M94_04315 [Actinomycetota bacterium]|nr:hypothetical protein [Actinomycetota bacterium]
MTRTRTRQHKQAGAALPRGARLLLAFVAAGAAASAIPALAGFSPDAQDVVRFALLGLAAAIAELCVIETGRNHGFPTALVFLVAGALLLPPELVALLALVQHSPELVRRQCPWYIQAFNISNYTINGLAAYAAATLVARVPLGGDDARVALGALAACVVFVAVNHLLLATMLRLARGHSFRGSGLFGAESLSIDIALAALGLALAVFAARTPVLIPVALAPIVLVHRLLLLKAALDSSTPPFALRAQKVVS